VWEGVTGMWRHLSWSNSRDKDIEASNGFIGKIKNSAEVVEDIKKKIVRIYITEVVNDNKEFECL